MIRKKIDSSTLNASRLLKIHTKSSGLEKPKLGSVLVGTGYYVFDKRFPTPKTNNAKKKAY
jgi:hypothetical protein